MASSTAKANGKADNKIGPTEYIVLEQVELKGEHDKTVVAWVEVGTAATPIRNNAVAEVAKEREGVWRAVPTRNWGEAVRTRKETTVKIKVEALEPF